MSKIGVFYGPEKGSTERVAMMIAEKLGADVAEVVSVEKASPDDFMKYDKMILGIATVGRDAWDTDHGRRGWDVFLPKFNLTNDSLTDKTIALFGLGNQITYPTLFCDAMGVLAKAMMDRGAKIVGEVSVKGYDFEESSAVVNGMFVGLPLDDDNEADKTEARVEAWLQALKGSLV